MENEQIKQKIVAETMELMSLKVDNEELVKHTFRAIRDRVEELHSTMAENNENYTKAFTVINEAMKTEYAQFSESTIYDEKAQLLIQLRHKAAEVCTLIKPS